MRLAIVITLLLSAPAMATDITGVPRIVDGDTVQIDATKIRLTHRRARNRSGLPRSHRRTLELVASRPAMSL